MVGFLCMAVSGEAGVTDGKPLLRVGPGLDSRKARLPETRAEFGELILIAALGMDARAGGKMARAAWPVHGRRMARLEVHFDAREAGIEERAVAPVAQREIAAYQPVQVVQDVQIEGRSDAQRVVIRRF